MLCKVNVILKTNVMNYCKNRCSIVFLDAHFEIIKTCYRY